MWFNRARSGGVSWLVVFLGNPGKEYENTRHNAGFMAVDAIAEEYSFAAFKSKFDGEIAEGKIGGEKVFILKPHTYMNLSGNAVVKAASFYKILPENIVVVHDDMDLPVGKLKAKIGGGAGGHNGLKSIDAAITPNYNRIRIGVGHAKDKGNDVVNYVLSGFGKEDKKVLDCAIELVVKTIEILIKKGVSEYSNQIGMAQR